MSRGPSIRLQWDTSKENPHKQQEREHSGCERLFYRQKRLSAQNRHSALENLVVAQEWEEHASPRDMPCRLMQGNRPLSVEDLLGVLRIRREALPLIPTWPERLGDCSRCI